MYSVFSVGNVVQTHPYNSQLKHLTSEQVLLGLSSNTLSSERPFLIQNPGKIQLFYDLIALCTPLFNNNLSYKFVYVCV